MKKCLALIISLLLILGVAGCAEVHDPADSGLPNIPVVPTEPVTPPEDEEDIFSVTLVYNERPFVPTEPISALWNDGMSIHTATFDGNGIARIDGLDGDYRVTLSATPSGYTYEPNIYTASNDCRDIEIRLYKLTLMSGKGDDFYNPIQLQSTGAYRVTLEYAEQEVYFSYTPILSGAYTLQSMIDVTANEVNPILDKYIANKQFKLLEETVDGGGSESTYTKNFRWEINVSAGTATTSGEVGNSWMFCLRAESVNRDAFPIDVDFLLERDGEYSGIVDPLPAEPTENFRQTPEYPSSEYTWVYAANASNGYILDSDRYKLNPVDGYYHEYDEDTDTFGAILYGKVSKDNEVLTTDGGTGFTYGMVTCRWNGYDYKNFILQYAEWTNSDGVYAVTEELRSFFQNYSLKERFFNDGAGNAEVYAHYNAAEDDQWLFACGTYVAK